MLLVGLEDNLLWGDDFGEFWVGLIFLLLFRGGLQILLDLCAIIYSLLVPVDYDVLARLRFIILYLLFLLFLTYGLFLPLFTAPKPHVLFFRADYIILTINNFPLSFKKKPITMHSIRWHFWILQSIKARIYLRKINRLLIPESFWWVIMCTVWEELYVLLRGFASRRTLGFIHDLIIGGFVNALIIGWFVHTLIIGDFINALIIGRLVMTWIIVNTWGLVVLK